VKYISQFSLLQNEPERFDEQLKINQSHISEQYLKEFQEVFSTVNAIDIKQNEISIENYLTSLLKSASENDIQDSYSRATLFTEQLYSETQQSTLESLITSTLNLLENTEYREIMDKHVSVQSLTELLLDLVMELRKAHELNSKKIWINELVTDIKEILKFRTSSTLVEDVDFYKILSENEKVKKFIELVHQVQKDREIHREQMQGFKIIATAKKFTGAMQLKQKSRRNTGFSSAFNLYSEPYKYLLELKKIDILESIEYYKYFVDVEYKTLNKHGFPVSGGERSEFNLLQQITDALKFDILLIDEPESSFDNTFLKNDVNELLKEISKQMPVIIVTHNNTVGASIYPDYMIYTKKNLSASKITYQIFMGYPHSKKLKELGGDEIDNYDILLKCLEAGTEAYNDRKLRNYDILKN
jgi:Fe-S cluster assembly ATPase SufC